MRRSAWTIGAALLAALSLVVAACGGSSRDEGRSRPRTQPAPSRPARRQAGRQADRPVGRRRRLHRLRSHVQPDGRLHLLLDAEAAVLVQARRLDDDGPGPRRGSAGGLRGRQDRHRQDQAGREVLAALQTRKSRPPTSSTRSSAASPPRPRTASRTSYYGDLEGAKVGVDAGTEISGITTPDDYTVVLKFKRAVGGVMAAGALGYPAHRPGAEGLRAEVRQGADVDLRREPARHRPVHDRERRQRQVDRL